MGTRPWCFQGPTQRFDTSTADGHHRPAREPCRDPRAGPTAATGAPPDPSELVAEPGGSEALTTQGRIVRIRTVTAADVDALRALNGRTTDASLYLRFFALNRRVADDYVTSLVRPPDAEHHALIGLFSDQVVAVAGYERLNASQAEVALLVEDAHQGEGLGTLLLEHLAAQARTRGIRELVGDVLIQNRQMASVLSDSGLPSSHTVEGGVARFRVATTPDEITLAAFDQREERAQRASLEPLLEPHSVAVVGAGRRAGVGHEVLAAIMGGDFDGTVYPGEPTRPQRRRPALVREGQRHSDWRRPSRHRRRCPFSGERRDGLRERGREGCRHPHRRPGRGRR